MVFLLNISMPLKWGKTLQWACKKHFIIIIIIEDYLESANKTYPTSSTGYTIFKETEMGRWVHLVCALYIPGVAFSEVSEIKSCNYSRDTSESVRNNLFHLGNLAGGQAVLPDAVRDGLQPLGPEDLCTVRGRAIRQDGRVHRL